MTLAREIMDSLGALPGIDIARLHVSIAEGGEVTLHGIVHTYADKCAVEETALCVPGVATVRNAIEVRLTIGDYRSDATLERVLREMFESLARMPPDLPRASVSKGWVTLEGTVPYAFQKQLVANAVREMAGVVGVSDHIVVEKERRPPDRSPVARATS